MGPSLILYPRLQQLDEENSELRSCTPCLKANIERLEEVSCLPGALSGQGQALHCVVTKTSHAGLHAFPHPLDRDVLRQVIQSRALTASEWVCRGMASQGVHHRLGNCCSKEQADVAGPARPVCEGTSSAQATALCWKVLEPAWLLSFPTDTGSLGQRFLLRLTRGLNPGMSLRGRLQLDPSRPILQMFTERLLLPHPPLPAKCLLGSSEP